MYFEGRVDRDWPWTGHEEKRRGRVRVTVRFMRRQWIDRGAKRNGSWRTMDDTLSFCVCDSSETSRTNRN